MSIQIPNNALVVMIGPAGCGKSTFATNYFGADNVISSDRCRFMVCGDETRQDVNWQAFHLFHTWIDLRMSCGMLTVADATNVQSTPRKKLRGIAMKHNRPTVALLIDVPLKTVHAQNNARDRVVPAHVVDKHYKQYLDIKMAVSNETFDAHYIIRDRDNTSIQIV